MQSKLVKKPSATLTVNNKQLELPVYGGSVGPDAIDIRKLYSDGKVFTYDPGFTSTGSCESQITYIDGDEGVLLYRGYPIDQLAEHSNFLEVCYLLANGELPNQTELARLRRSALPRTIETRPVRAISMTPKFSSRPINESTRSSEPTICTTNESSVTSTTSPR